MRYNAVFYPDATNEELQLKIGGCGGTVEQILRGIHVVTFSGNDAAARKVHGLQCIAHVVPDGKVRATHAA